MKKIPRLKVIALVVSLELATLASWVQAQERIQIPNSDLQQSSARQKEWLARSEAISRILNNEEKLVRSAYVKLMRYSSSYNSEIAATSNRAHQAEDDLSFDLRPLRTGPIEEIYDRPFGELVSKQYGDALKLERIIYRYNDGPEHLMYKAAVIYHDDQYSSESWDRISVREMLKARIAHPEDVRMYTSYDILVRAGLGQRAYRGLALYTLGGQYDTSSIIRVFDYIVGPEVMSALLAEDRPPVRAPWSKYVTSARYAAFAEAAGKASQEQRSLVPANSPVGFLPGDDFDYSMAGAQNKSAQNTKGLTAAAVCSANVVVSEVGFSADIKLHHWTGDPATAIAIDPNDTQPVWTSNGNVNYPAAYVSGQTPVMFATLTIASPPPASTATVRIKNGTNVVATVSGVDLSGNAVRITGISLPSFVVEVRTISQRDVTLAWEISYDNGQTWAAAGQSGPHRLYMTYQQPYTNPFITGQLNEVVYPNTYDLALEKACGPANGVGLTGIIAITAGIDADIRYNPANGLENNHPLKAYATTAGTQCSDNANLLRGLLRTIGIEATTLYFWGSPSNQGSVWLEYYQPIVDSGGGNSGGAYVCTFMVTEQAHDCAPNNPHFTFHAIVSAGGSLYDPSYGKSRPGLVFAETAPGAGGVQVMNQALAVTGVQLTGIVCPHTTPVLSCP